MGLEIILGVASLAVGVISGVNQMSAADKSAKLAKQSANAQKERNNIIQAQQKIGSLESRRQLVREQRVRRAAMLTASRNTGGAGSSGESGALSALGANFGNLISQGSGESLANEGINFYNQKALDFDTEARIVGAKADAFSSFLGVFQSGFSQLGNVFDQG